MIWHGTVLSLLSASVVLGQGSDLARPLIDQDKLESAGLSRYWQARIPLVEGDSIEQIHLVDRTLYVATDLGRLYSVTADTGLIRWGARVTEPDFTIFPPTHLLTKDGTGPAIVTTTTQVLFYDRFEGRLLRQFTPFFVAGGPMLGYDSNIFAGSMDGHVYALTLLPGPDLPPFKRWEVMAGGPVTAAPILFHAGTLIFASQAGAVYACRAVDKSYLWSARTDGPITADLAVDEGGVYVASSDRRLYKFHTGTGRTLWRYQLPSPLTVGPKIVGRTVYQWSERAGLVAIDADSGREKWRRETGRSLVAHTVSGDIIHTADRTLAIVDHATGDVVHEIDAPLVTGVVVNVRDDAGYLFNRDGRVQSIRLSRVPYLRRQQIIAARRVLNKAPQRSTMKEASNAVTIPPRKRSRDPFRSRRDGGR